MSRFNSLTIVAIALIATLQPTASQSAEPPAELDIRGDNGQIIISADQIRSYDWPTHTLTLAPGTRAKLARKLIENMKLTEMKKLVSGIPFTVSVGGKPVYKGTLTTSVSSFSFDTPAIVVDPVINVPTLGEDQLRIQLGYPTQQFFEGDDPRADKRIEEALKAAGKLINPRQDRIEWVAACLQEMQAVKQGSTREELLRVFVEEGGLSNRRERRYAYRDCPYFKVDVKFEAADDADEKNKESPNDKVSQISTPFLEWQIAD
jgi:hypothetical protein